MKNEALKLADELDALHQYVPSEAPTMIRRLVEELDKQSPSMFTILSCGCKSEFMGFPSEWDGETRECEPCVNYGSLCEQHFMEYEARPAQYLQQIKPTITKLDGKVVAVTMTDDDHRITEVLWEAPKPLSDEEIEECYWGDGYPDNPRHPKEFARAIEERHGIK